MADIVTTPHDRFTKANLQEVAIARAFLQIHLDAAIRNRIDLTSMKLTNNEFVLPHLRKIQSDVVYECLIDGKDSYIYFLMEGQSTAEELMAFRKLQYNVALMDHHLKMGNNKLPVIVSICLYNGKRSPYPYSTDVFDCFESVELAKEMMFKPFKLIDLSVLSDKEIEQHGIAALFEMLLKHHDTKQLYNLLAHLVKLDLFKETLDAIKDDNYIVNLLEYALNTGEEREHPVEKILQLLAENAPKHKEHIMTVADQLRQQGMEQAKPLYLAEGIEKGIEKVAKNMLEKGADTKFIAETTGLSNKQIEAIKHSVTIH